MTDSRKLRRRVPRLRLALGAVAVIAVAVGAITLSAWRAGRLDTLDMSTALIVCIVVGIAAAGLALTYTPGVIPDTGAVPASHHIQKRTVWNLMGNVFAGLIWTNWGVRQAVEAFGEGDRLEAYGFAALVLVWLAVAPAALMRWGGRGSEADPDRELSLAFRNKATASGFWALLVGGAVAFLTSFSAPAAMPYLIPLALWLGGAVACTHFVWLHHRAEQDLDDDG